MNGDTLRYKTPVGSNRTLVTAEGEFYVTIIEHDADGLYAGLHPDILFFHKDAVLEVL